MKNHNREKDPGVFIIWLVAAALISLFMLVAEAEASRTMHLVDSYIDDGVKVCVYSDGKHYAYTERNRASTCPYTHIEY
ncbi:TPA: hypothetical protein LAQ47_004044 [Escherichia coli]|nr:hypothetical protein [Escherichia coli]HBJ1428727.1 hypothetical protein [Escherichia coli]